MTMSSLTLIVVADGPHGITEHREITQPLTEAALVHAGLMLMTGERDSSGRRIVALRASAP